MYWSLCSSIKKNIANTRTKWCKPGIAMRSPFSSLNPKSTFGWENANLLITNKEYIWFYSLLIKPTLETSLCCLLGYKICNLHCTFWNFVNMVASKGSMGCIQFIIDYKWSKSEDEKKNRNKKWPKFILL